MSYHTASPDSLTLSRESRYRQRTRSRSNEFSARPKKGQFIRVWDMNAELSHLLSAVDHALRPCASRVWFEYDPMVGMMIQVECRVEHQSRVVDMLMHGVLHDGYDYRFTTSYATSFEEGQLRTIVTAYPAHNAGRTAL